MCQRHLGLRRLDAAFGIDFGSVSRRRQIAFVLIRGVISGHRPGALVLVFGAISKRRRAAAVQGAAHIFMLDCAERSAIRVHLPR
jgi:hypothetical protein